MDEPKNGPAYSLVERQRLRKGRRLAIAATLAAVATTAAIDLGAWQLGVGTGSVTVRQHDAIVGIVFPLNAAVAGVASAVLTFRFHPVPARRVPVAVGWSITSPVAYFMAYFVLGLTINLFWPSRLR